MRWYQPLLWLWASPTTLLGLLPAPIVLCQGGTIRIVRRVVEIEGGIVTRFLQRGLPWVGGGAAMTLGHVVWGRNLQSLSEARDHEHVHVRQYERWGPFFVPAYLLASLLVKLRGKHPYWDNPFEREAYDEAP
jgi:hypothetical protein